MARCSAPAAQARTNAYAPGGPTSNTAQSSTAATATADTTSTPAHGICATQSPSVTAPAREMTTAASCTARLRIRTVVAVADRECAYRRHQARAHVFCQRADHDRDRGADGRTVAPRAIPHVVLVAYARYIVAPLERIDDPAALFTATTPGGNHNALDAIHTLSLILAVGPITAIILALWSIEPVDARP